LYAPRAPTPIADSYVRSGAGPASLAAAAPSPFVPGAMRLTTPRLELVALGPEHMDGVSAVYRHPEVRKMSGDWLGSDAIAKQLRWSRRTARLDQLLEAKARRDNYNVLFGIFRAGKLVGVAQLNSTPPSRSPVGKIGEVWAHIGCHLLPEVWNLGIATEATTRLLAFAFGTLGVDGIHTGALRTNKGSIGVLTKLGFVDASLSPTSDKPRLYLHRDAYLRKRSAA
jgi:RimJ/RimL family protein N-acetyltransferase